MNLTPVINADQALAEANAKGYNISICARVKNAANKILLIKRAISQNYPGVWEMPGGGVESGETLDEALRRELREEAGLIQLDAVKLLGYFEFENTETGKIKRKFCFDVQTDQIPKLSEEHDDYKWFTRSEIDGLKRESDYDPYEMWDNQYHMLVDF